MKTVLSRYRKITENEISLYIDGLAPSDIVALSVAIDRNVKYIYNVDTDNGVLKWQFFNKEDLSVLIPILNRILADCPPITVSVAVGSVISWNKNGMQLELISNITGEVITISDEGTLGDEIEFYWDSEATDYEIENNGKRVVLYVNAKRNIPLS